MIGTLILSIGAINALIPILIILILIAAAAGSTRGSKLFELFGISTLLGINFGRGTIARKSPFKTKRLGKGKNPFGRAVEGAFNFNKRFKEATAKSSTTGPQNSTNSTSNQGNAKISGVLAPPFGYDTGKGGPRGDGYSTDNRYRRRRPGNSTSGRSYSSENSGNEGKSGYSGASPSSSPSPYSVLGLLPDAKPSEIKAAWKRLSVKYNTGRYTSSELDANPALKEQVAELNKKFIEAREAYETLKNKFDIK